VSSAKPGRWRRTRRRLFRAISPRRFRHTWLHRVVGERLFDRHLWVPDRRSLAGGLALGVFLAVIPVVGMHVILALVLGLALRVNLPAAVAACWTPAYVLWPFLHRFGMAVAGRPDVDEVTGVPSWLRTFMEHGQALWVGCFVFGVFAAGVTYVAAWHGWRWIGRISPFHRRAESLRKRELFRLHAVGPEPAAEDGKDGSDPDEVARRASEG
jgi:uncharacterized protein (DUF2062 family)